MQILRLDTPHQLQDLSFFFECLLPETSWIGHLNAQIRWVSAYLGMKYPHRAHLKERSEEMMQYASSRIYDINSIGLVKTNVAVDFSQARLSPRVRCSTASRLS